jgi:hypothetical protein
MYNIRAIFKRNPCSKDQTKNKRKIEMPQQKDAHLLAQKHTEKMGRVTTTKTWIL